MSVQEYTYSEDSQLLGQTISLLESGEKVLEIGVGRGGNLPLLTEKFQLVVSTDIARPNAVSRFKQNLVSFVLADRATCFRSSIFDVVVFNPPYVPNDEIVDKTVDGGPHGVEVPLQFLESALEVAKPGGKILMLLSSDDTLSLFEKFCVERNLAVEKLSERRLFFETIFVFLITKPQ